MIHLKWVLLSGAPWASIESICLDWRHSQIVAYATTLLKFTSVLATYMILPYHEVPLERHQCTLKNDGMGIHVFPKWAASSAQCRGESRMLCVCMCQQYLLFVSRKDAVDRSGSTGEATLCFRIFRRHRNITGILIFPNKGASSILSPTCSIEKLNAHHMSCLSNAGL